MIRFLNLEPAPLFFLKENPMTFRPTILLALLLLLAPGAMLCGEDKAESGTASLFDGKTLKGWDGNSKFWSVKDGVITGQTTEANPTQGNTFLIWRAGTLENFQLDLEFRMVGGNSGIQYRSKDLGNWVVGGYQADIDAGFKFIGILYEERGRGILAMRGTKVEISESGEKKTEGRISQVLGDLVGLRIIEKKSHKDDGRIKLYRVKDGALLRKQKNKYDSEDKRDEELTAFMLRLDVEKEEEQKRLIEALGKLSEEIRSIS